MKGWLVGLLWIGLGILQGMDYVTTYFGIQSGGQELNPLMAPLIEKEQSFTETKLFVIKKTIGQICVAIGFYYLLFKTTKDVGGFSVLLLSVLYLIVVSWNFLLLLR